MDKGKYPDLLQRKAQLLAQLDRRQFAGGFMDAGTAAILKELDGIEKRIAASDKAWESLPTDARMLYKAWQDLRAGDGGFMLGINLGADPKGQALDEPQRQRYQAETFSELCAESFMHLAMGDLDKHVAMVDGNPDVPSALQQAWKVVQTILHQYGDPILGPGA